MSLGYIQGAGKEIKKTIEDLEKSIRDVDR